MNDGRYVFVVMVLLVSLISAPAMAVPILDGKMMGDWGANFTNGEETFGRATSFVGPGWGGQLFDVEKIGLEFDGNDMYFGLQTGFNFKDGVTYKGRNYKAGDLFIDFGSDNSWDIAINPRNLRVKDVSRYSDPTFASSAPFKVTRGLRLGTASGTRTTGTNAYDELVYSLEGVLDLDALGLDEFIGQSAIIHWTMSCGNDVLEHKTDAPVPEPATLFLMGTGLVGIAGMKRKMGKKKKG